VDEHTSVADARGEDPIAVDAQRPLDLVEQRLDETHVVVTRAPVTAPGLTALGRRRVVEGFIGADRPGGTR